MSWQQEQQNLSGIGATLTTTGNYDSTQFYPATPAASDWRDNQITNLNLILQGKDAALREAMIEIGQLHMQIKSMQAFDKWSEGMAKQEKNP